MVLSSAADVTRLLRRCFYGGIVEFVDETYKRTLLYISCYFSSVHFVKSPRNARDTLAEELGTMSENNLRAGITPGKRPIYLGNSLSYPLSFLGIFD